MRGFVLQSDVGAIDGELEIVECLGEGDLQKNLWPHEERKLIQKKDK